MQLSEIVTLENDLIALNNFGIYNIDDLIKRCCEKGLNLSDEKNIKTLKKNAKGFLALLNSGATKEDLLKLNKTGIYTVDELLKYMPERSYDFTKKSALRELKKYIEGFLSLVSLEITTKKIKQLANAGIFGVDDLLNYIPKTYYDFSIPLTVSQIIEKLNSEQDRYEISGLSEEEAVKKGYHCSIIGKVVKFTNTNRNILSIQIEDITGRKMNITWFNQDYIYKSLHIGQYYIFCGKCEFNNWIAKDGTTVNGVKMVAPKSFGTDIEKHKRITPVYKPIKNMNNDYLWECVEKAFKYIPSEYLEESIKNKFGLIDRKLAYINIHTPESKQLMIKARNRFIFDDMFFFNYQIQSMQYEKTSSKSQVIITKHDKFKEFMDKLPFKLTDGEDSQLSVLREIFKTVKNQNILSAFVQGDVGCGKTVISLLMMILLAENGYQAVLMAPTDNLAYQHYKEMVEKIEGFGFTTAFLSGSVTGKKKQKLIEEIREGKIDLIVGTHSVFQDDVSFKNLGIAIIDEEHKFGVMQRTALKEKGNFTPHYVTLSATPIPRTLGIALFGGLMDVYTIKTLPSGRKAIKTTQTRKAESTYSVIHEEIKKGRQCYIVCPFVEENDSEEYKHITSVETAYQETVEYFKDYPEIKIVAATGKMKKDEMQEELGKFTRNEAQILIATTIVEVGVNVPNSTAIVIRNAERFGLAQLHQLRGRVGRGSHQSYCILESKKPNPKLDIMCFTTDGFVIAQEDLKLRGSGDYLGHKQTGQNKYLELAMKYSLSYQKVVDLIKEILVDPYRSDKYKFIIDLDLSDKTPKEEDEEDENGGKKTNKYSRKKKAATTT